MESIHWIREEFWTQLAERTLQWAASVLPAVALVLLLGALLSRGLTYGCKRLDKHLTETGNPEEMKRNQTLIDLIQSVGRVALLTLTAMLLMSQVGLQLGPLLASAGVVGLAVGFGAQELVKDFFAGFFLLLENHIRIGDVAQINGTGGLVESMGLRTTVLRDLSGVVHVFRNGSITTLSNMTKEWSAMVFDVGVAYKEDTDEVAEIMGQVAQELRADSDLGPKILEPLEVFGVDAFGDSAVVVKARLKTKPIAQWEVGREYRRRLKKAFDARGIEIPFPHRTLYWGEASPPFRVLTQPPEAGKSS